MLTQEEADALQTVVRYAAIPTRPVSYVENSFWAIPINLTRCRPVPGGGSWRDLIEVPVRQGYPRAVKLFVASGQTEGTLEYRWLNRGLLVEPDAFQITNTVEKNIDRFAAFPYPVYNRPTTVWGRDVEQLVLQVRNLTGAQQLAFAAVYGWYYPQLDTPEEIGSMEGITDQARGLYG